MKIAINGGILGERPTGLGVVIRNLARSLTQIHPDTELYSSITPAGIQNIHPVSELQRTENGVRGQLYRFLWLNAKLPGDLRRIGADCLLNPLPEGPLFPGRPMVTMVMDLIPLRYSEGHRKASAYFKSFVPALLKKSSAVISISEATKLDICRFYRIAEDNVRVIPLGYDASRFYPKLDENGDASVLSRPYALYTGNLRPHKNLLNLIRAYKHSKNNWNFELIIAGSGDSSYTAQLMKEAEGGSIRFMPYVPDETLTQLIRNAEFVILPSLIEGFGLTVLESMASGVRVCVSDIGVMHEVADSAAVYFDPSDIASIADGMCTMTNETESEKTRRIKEGLDRAGMFSWEETARRVLQICEQVIG